MLARQAYVEFVNDIVVGGLATTRLGKAMRAVSDNPALSASSGMRVDGVINRVWILGTALTGLSGVLLAIDKGPAAYKRVMNGLIAAER